MCRELVCHSCSQNLMSKANLTSFVTISLWLIARWEARLWAKLGCNEICQLHEKMFLCPVRRRSNDFIFDESILFRTKLIQRLLGADYLSATKHSWMDEKWYMYNESQLIIIGQCPMACFINSFAIQNSHCPIKIQCAFMCSCAIPQVRCPRRRTIVLHC